MEPQPKDSGRHALSWGDFGLRQASWVMLALALACDAFALITAERQAAGAAMVIAGVTMVALLIFHP